MKKIIALFAAATLVMAATAASAQGPVIAEQGQKSVVLSTQGLPAGLADLSTGAAVGIGTLAIVALIAIASVADDNNSGSH